MQPEDEKQQFQQPQTQQYFSAAPPTVDDQAHLVDEPTSVVVPASDPLEGVEAIQWQAPEYIQQHKSPLWYVGFIIVVLLLVLAAVLLMKSWTFALLIPVMAAALFAYSVRPPQMMNYALSEKGLYINDTLHGFAEFKSFGVVRTPESLSLELVPVRRFRPRLSVYFHEENGEQIVDILGVRLPMQEIKLDAFDKIVRFLGL